MYKQSLIPIYGGRAPPAYVAASGSAIVIFSSTRNWVTTIKGTRWSQIGRDTGYPVSYMKEDWNSEYAVIGQSTLVVANRIQLAGLGPTTGVQIPFGYYIKSGFGYRPILVNSLEGQSLYGWGTRSLAAGGGTIVAGGSRLGVPTYDKYLTVLTSTNGTTWTEVNIRTDLTNAASIVTFNNAKYYLQFTSGTAVNEMYRSPTGSTWTSIPFPVTGQGPWTVATVNSQIFARPNGGTNYYVSANDGTSWTTVAKTGQDQTPRLFVNGVYISYASAGAGANYYTSTDGLTWTTRANTLGLFQMAVSASMFKAIDTNGMTIYQSTDGVSWTIDQTAMVTPNPLGLVYGSL